MDRLAERRRDRPDWAVSECEAAWEAAAPDLRPSSDLRQALHRRLLPRQLQQRRRPQRQVPATTEPVYMRDAYMRRTVASDWPADS